MTPEVESDNAHTTNVENGRNTLGNLLNVDGVGGPNTAVRNARRVLGYTTDTGALRHNNDEWFGSPFGLVYSLLALEASYCESIIYTVAFEQERRIG